MIIPLGFDTNLIQGGICHPVFWNSSIYSHLLVIGSTGSGKTYFNKLILGKCALAKEKPLAFVLDYKNVDYRFLKGTPNARYWGYDRVIDGFNEVYQLFEQRLKGNSELQSIVVLIEEYASWLNAQDKKVADELMKKVANLLFLSRALGFSIIISCQRAMATQFSGGARDCLGGVIFLGSPSKESIGSFCDKEESSLMHPCPRGKGYVLFEGQPPRGITVPTVRNEGRLARAIERVVTRQ